MIEIIILVLVWVVIAVVMYLFFSMKPADQSTSPTDPSIMPSDQPIPIETPAPTYFPTFSDQTQEGSWPTVSDFVMFVIDNVWVFSIVLTLLIAMFLWYHYIPQIPKTPDEKIQTVDVEENISEEVPEKSTKATFAKGYSMIGHIEDSVKILQNCTIPGLKNKLLSNALNSMVTDVHTAYKYISEEDIIYDNLVRQVFTVYLNHLDKSLDQYVASIKTSRRADVDSINLVAKDIYVIAKQISRSLKKYIEDHADSKLQISAQHNSTIKSMMLRTSRDKSDEFELDSDEWEKN